MKPWPVRPATRLPITPELLADRTHPAYMPRTGPLSPPPARAARPAGGADCCMPCCGFLILLVLLAILWRLP